MMEYWNDVKNRNKKKTPSKPNIPVFQHSSIPIGAKPLSSAFFHGFGFYSSAAYASSPRHRLYEPEA